MRPDDASKLGPNTLLRLHLPTGELTLWCGQRPPSSLTSLSPWYPVRIQWRLSLSGRAKRCWTHSWCLYRRVKVCPWWVSCRSYVATSTSRLLVEMGGWGRANQQALEDLPLKNQSVAVDEEESFYLGFQVYRCHQGVEPRWHQGSAVNSLVLLGQWV